MPTAAPRFNPHQHDADVITIRPGQRMPAGSVEPKPRKPRRTAAQIQEQKERAWLDDMEAEQAAGTIDKSGEVVPEGEAPAEKAAARAERKAARAARPDREVGGVTVSDASGFVLALVVWSWIGLPYLQHGPTGVRDVWRAKFFNKGPKGEALL